MFELAFESALIIDLLVELGSDPVGLVEEFEAQTPAADLLWPPWPDAPCRVAAREHEARYAVGRDIKGNLRLGQSRADLPRIVRVEIGVKTCASRCEVRTRAVRLP